MGQIHYDYAGIDGLLSQAKSEQAQLVQLTEDLNQIRNQCQSLWQDPASAEAFQATYQKWIQGSHEVQEVLAAIVRAAGTGNSDMQSTNSSIANAWG